MQKLISKRIWMDLNPFYGKFKEGCLAEQLCGWQDGRMDGWMDGWMDDVWVCLATLSR